MPHLLNFPVFISVISVVVLWVSALTGASIIKKLRALNENSREDFGFILAAILTLLGLIIGFSFSMAISRYDQRRNYEEDEANAIGTEYVRAGLLPAPDAEKVRLLLRKYLEQRILFYRTREASELRQINATTTQLQNELWSAVQGPAGAQPTPVVALVVSGMNDVLNSQGYTQAAWRNRIPRSAWVLMLLIAICCNVLVGYGSHPAKPDSVLLLVLPVVVSIAFLLVADIDSPRGGLIHIPPDNLASLAQSLHSN
jgi:hypothetical protein